MSTDSEPHQPGVSGTLGWWWIVLGTLFTGFSVFSLYLRIAEVGPKGLLLLVHERYEAMRDLIFTPIENMFPDLALSELGKTIALLAVVQFTVYLRSVQQVLAYERAGGTWHRAYTLHLLFVVNFIACGVIAFILIALNAAL